LHPVGSFGLTCTSGLLPALGGAPWAYAPVEKQTAVRMANALIVIPLCLQLLYCAGLRTILTNGARGLLPCRVFLSLDQPYHPAPRQSAKCMNDVVPIEHG